jgi:hypothetical protein
MALIALSKIIVYPPFDYAELPPPIRRRRGGFRRFGRERGV